MFYYPGAMKAPRLLAVRTCETTKIPAGLQKRDFWGCRYRKFRIFQILTKPLKGNEEKIMDFGE